MKCKHCQEALETIKELREACAAAMRVVADLDVMYRLESEADTRQQRFVDELRLSGVKDGFGKRADALIKRLEAR